MGATRFFSSSKGEEKEFNLVGGNWRDEGNNIYVNQQANQPLPNPKPDNYEILEHKQIGSMLVIKIKYLDCTNYEGVKILVYNTTLQKLKSQKYIDPHFCDNEKFISPIARFMPTEQGWNDAINYASNKNK